VLREAFVTTHSRGFSGLRVLMADPDFSLFADYREPLLQEGFHLTAASYGLECVDRLRESVPDVLVLEPHMPWGGGDGILAIMSEDPRLASVPVMVLTSCCDPQVLNGVARFPIGDYCHKPITPNRLAARLRKLLAHPKLRFTLAEQTGHLRCEIARRTGDRIRNLRVDAAEGRVIVRGQASSKHVRELALAAVRDAFEATESQADKIELDIQVS
jgi:DNA-binding response OmpR family regulator